MMHLLRKWGSEVDHLTRAMVETLVAILDDVELTEAALEEFLIVCSRFVDAWGDHRIDELRHIFRTSTPEGKAALLQSLEYVQRWTGGLEAFKQNYPVSIIPARPTFPQFKIIGIERIADRIHRVLDSNAVVYGSTESVRSHVRRTGRLPWVPKQKRPARRSKPLYHWCSYGKWESPEKTREALQILPEWSDCRLRATILTRTVKRSAYVAFNGDRPDPDSDALAFHGYFFEPLAQDHPPLEGGGSQIGVDGAPPVAKVETWDERSSEWRTIVGES